MNINKKLDSLYESASIKKVSKRKAQKDCIQFSIDAVDYCDTNKFKLYFDVKKFNSLLTQEEKDYLLSITRPAKIRPSTNIVPKFFDIDFDGYPEFDMDEYVYWDDYDEDVDDYEEYFEKNYNPDFRNEHQKTAMKEDMGYDEDSGWVYMNVRCHATNKKMYSTELVKVFYDDMTSIINKMKKCL